ncbi:MAG: acyl-CoA dehydrogenase family protein [Gammaproteobacteria bacterium]
MVANLARNEAATFEHLMERAEALRRFVESQADEAENLRHMTDATVETFHAEGLYRMLLPKELGGSELTWVEAMRVTEKIAYADGAAGWCLMVGNIEVGAGGAYLSDAGVAHLFSHGNEILIAGQGIPRGYATKVDGGYMIHGDWSYGSGIYHADYIHTGCILMDGGKPVMNDNGLPEVIICHVEKKDIRLKDNWDVMGLRGTGSFDYSIDEMFVSEDLCHSFSLKEPLRGSNNHSVGLVGYTTWGHTSFALGVGRRALDEVAEIARTKGNVFGLLGDGASFQERYARAEAQYRSARELCYSAWQDLCDTLGSGGKASKEEIALIRLAMRHIHETVSDVCTFAHKAGGGASLRSSVLQRCYRDIHAGTQHILLSDQIVQDCGRVLLGMSPDAEQWTILGLKS